MNSSPRPASPRIGVVTVSYESDKVLPGFLDSVSSATDEPCQLVIADNKPTEHSPIARLAREHGALYLPLPTNLGYGAAMNRAVERLEPSVKWVLISNPDVILERGSLDALVASAEAETHVGSVGPAILTPTGSIYPSARRVPSIRTGIGHALFYNLWPNNAWSRAYLSESDAEPRDAGWLSGACLLVDRSVFEELGGFDDGYFMYFEDVDLGDRLARAGYRNLYRPQARVMHSGAHSTASSSERMLREHHKSASLFLSRTYSGPWLWPVRVALRIGLALRSQAEGRRARRRTEG